MISVRKIGKTVILRPAIYQLDAVTGRQLVGHLRDHVTSGTHILLDLTDVGFLNSEALGFLTMCCRRVRHHRGTLSVCCLQDGPRGVFEITKMSDVLSGVYETEEDALAAFERETCQ